MEGGIGHPREALDTIPAEVKKHFFQEKQPPNLITDYDAIGFDADHCFVKYNIRELVAFLVKIELDEFVELGYPKILAEGFNYETDLAMCMNASIFDIDNGLVIKLAEGKEVVQAMKGLKKLNRDEIQAVYGNPPLYDAYQWPNTTQLQKGKGAYWVFMTYFDTPKIAVVLRAIDLIDKGVMKGKTYYDVAMDLRTMVYRNYVHYNDKEVFPIATYGNYFIEIMNDPKKYIQYQPELRTSLAKLKKAGKKLFLGTNSHTEYSNLIMTATLGDDWRQFFDVVCCYCRKPLFFWDQKPSPFYTYDSSSKMLRGQQLFHGEEMSDRPGEIYTEGNSKTLTNYFKRLLKMSNDQELHVAFFGDQYITDVDASASNPGWDGIAVVEELAQYDSRLLYGTDCRMIENDTFWGKDTYFIEQSQDGRRPKRSYFVSQLEDCARYMLPFVRNIDQWLGTNTSQ